MEQARKTGEITTLLEKQRNLTDRQRKLVTLLATTMKRREVTLESLRALEKRKGFRKDRLWTSLCWLLLNHFVESEEDGGVVYYWLKKGVTV